MSFLLGKFDDVVDQIIGKINARVNSQIVFPTTLHELALKKLNKSEFSYQIVDVCTSDSMILTYLFRYKYGSEIERVYGPDLVMAVLDKTERSNAKFRNFFLAANRESMVEMKGLLSTKYPRMSADFAFLPKNILPRQEQAFLRKLQLKSVDIVWLGIGSPKQIELAVFLKKLLPRTTIFCVGAAFDFITNRKPQAPKWMQKSGLEWLFRLLAEPRRLWKRYLLIIPTYVVTSVFRSFFRK